MIMADKVTNDLQYVFDLQLRKLDQSATGDALYTRRISFDTYNQGEIKSSIAAFRQALLTDYKYMFQPSGWLDHSDEDSVYEIYDVTVTRVSKTELEYDFSE